MSFNPRLSLPMDDPRLTLEGRSCQVCGCTDDEECAGGCFWVEDDLCSRCA